MARVEVPIGDAEFRRRRSRGRRTLILIALLFFVPIWSAMYLIEGWRPGGTVNNGVLVEPMLRVAELRARSLDGNPLPESYFLGHWTLVYVLDGRCEEPCALALYHMRQVRIALGKDMARVRRLLLVESDPVPELRVMLERDHPGIDVFVAESRAPFEFDGAVHVVDPLGNLMLYYSPGAEPKGMIEDLKRLLKLSKVG